MIMFTRGNKAPQWTIRLQTHIDATHAPINSYIILFVWVHNNCSPSFSLFIFFMLLLMLLRRLQVRKTIIFRLYIHYYPIILCSAQQEFKFVYNHA